MISDVRMSSDVGSLLQFLLATHPVGEVEVVDGAGRCDGMFGRIRCRRVVSAGRGGRTRWQL